MATTLDESPRAANTPAQTLRTTRAAVRVNMKWLGVRKTLTPEQKNQAAYTSGAEGIRGVEPQDLRYNQGLRQHAATEMSRVPSVLDGLLVDRPRRNILRRPK